MMNTIPERAVDIINTLMSVYQRKNVEDRNRIADSTIKFIDDRKKDLGEELSEVEGDIEKFKQDNGIADMGTQASLLVSAKANTEVKLEEAKLQLGVIGTISDYIQKVDDKLVTLPASLLDNKGLSELLTRYNFLTEQIDRADLTMNRDNPTVRTLRKQKDEVKKSLANALASSKKETELKVRMIEQSLKMSVADIRAIPKVERLALEYSRKQQIKQELYIFLLKKREETAIEKSSTVADGIIVDTALTNGIVAPDKKRILLMSFLLGALLPFAVIIIRRALNIRIISKGDILKATTIPIIGEIGNNGSGESVAVSKNSRTIISEQFRALRTNLQYLLTQKDQKVIMVTSSMSGEGKSFIAINLSVTLAMSGKKVVIMELDLRKPKISKMLGLNNEVGFSNYSIGKASFEDVLIPSGVDPNLFILPSGPIPPNPAELILMKSTEELFAYLREHFDYVIVDTSPVGLVTDAQLLNRYADTAMYVVRQGYTYKQQLGIPNELYYGGRIPKLNIILNDVVANRGFAYGYGYEEGYG
jgi:capsular exopolysaccharide synthesis family protein